MEGCDFSQWPTECWAEDLFTEDHDLYIECLEIAGCGGGVNAMRRPMYDKMSFRRK